MTDAIAMGRAIREARLRKGMSLGQLASAVGRSSASVRRWERGEVPPAIGLIDDLAEVLDLDPDELRRMRPQPQDEGEGEGVDDETPPRVTTAEQPLVPVADPPAISQEAPTRAPRGFLGDLGLALRELTSGWSGWIRGLLTAAILIVMLFVLIWALGELVGALHEIWDSFDTGSSV
jgi:transcriptional regulator with XRE-family HTH domain